MVRRSGKEGKGRGAQQEEGGGMFMMGGGGWRSEVGRSRGLEGEGDQTYSH